MRFAVNLYFYKHFRPEQTMKNFFRPIHNKIIDAVLWAFGGFCILILTIHFIYLPELKEFIFLIPIAFGFISFTLLLFYRKKWSAQLKANAFICISIFFAVFDKLISLEYLFFSMFFTAIVVSSLFFRKRIIAMYLFLSILLIGLSNLTRNSDFLFKAKEVIFAVPSALFEAERFIGFTFTIILIVFSIYNLFQTILNHSVSSIEEQKKFHALFDQAYSFITLLDVEGRVMEVNQAALFYVNKKSEELKGQYFPDTPWWNHNPQTRHVIENMLKACMAGDFKRFEISHSNLEGKINIFDYTLKPIFGDNDLIKLIIAEGRDITKIKRAEQALIESEERLTAFSESTFEGLIILNQNRIIDANDSALKMFGFSRPSDVIGHKTVDNFVKASDKKKITDFILQGIHFPTEMIGLKSNGTEIPLEVQGREIMYRGEPHFIIAIRDLSERKRAQQALIDSEEKYRLIAENINDVIWKIDLNLNFTYISSSVFTMLGYTVEEAMDLSLDKIFSVRDYHKLLRLIVQKKNMFFEGDKQVLEQISFEALAFTKNGEPIWIQLNARPIPSSFLKPIEILGIIRNIDPLKRAQIDLSANEQRLIRQNEEYEKLNEELKELNIKLLNAKDKAEESDRLKSSFLANMSHEIRTPMNSIIGFSKMCLRDQLDEDKRKKYAGYVIENGEQLLSIVNDILDLSKIEAGHIKIKPVIFCLNGLIDNLYLNFQQHNTKGLLLMKQKGLPDSLCQVLGDKVRLTQILGNLLNNAMKFTNKGHIRFGYTLSDRQIQFSVEDTGIGIKPELQTAIFERFRQADPETTRIYGGTGLGLAISKKLIEMMEGKIWLNSEYGKGSTFSFSIPYFPADNIVNKEDELVSNGIPVTIDERPVILIAEDEESNFIYLNEILSEKKYKVLWAKNGKDAVDFCSQMKEIQLVLMDIKMPGMDGFKATRLIKENRPNLPIIAQTAFAMISDRETAISNGCNDYLSKPIDPEILLEMISKYIVHFV